MKKLSQKNICMIPMILWIAIILLIVKMKALPNPLLDYLWYSAKLGIVDFSLHYKSMFVTITGVLMLALLAWQISKMYRKDSLFQKDTRILIPIVVYLTLAVF